MKEETQRTSRVNFRSLILVVLIMISVGIIALLQLKDSPFNPFGTPLLEKGVPAPNVSLPGLDGKNVSLADFKGKVVLLNIWATWCAPCVAEMPSMEKLYQELKGEDFELLAISVDESGAEAVKPFVEKYKLGFPVLLDTKGEIKDLYQATGIPESFIIDKNGMIVDKIIGPRDWATSEAIRYFRNIIHSN
ncbi:MAG: TlpA family protein disulfide reductase [Desulfobacterales bacterium]|nr:MAG: TlpA family protein disulfide reductase [Desulfobacterales bacterium]